MMGTGNLFSWRKGPWTPEEDKLLSQYLNFHGEGNWSSVSRCSGLNRSGKSCRLRWVNYLRPGLKKGQLTPQEESIIIELHALWGNKWSTIARYLPGRTDNEVKNYWRTHFKKKDISSITTRDRKKQLKRKSQIPKPQKYYNIDNMQQPELAKVLVINKEQDSSTHIDHEDERKERAGSEVEDGIMTNLLLKDHKYYFPEMCNIDQDEDAGWSQFPNNIAADYNNNNHHHHEEEDVLWGSLWNWNLDDHRNFDSTTTTNQFNKLPTKINTM